MTIQGDPGREAERPERLHDLGPGALTWMLRLDPTLRAPVEAGSGAVIVAPSPRTQDERGFVAAASARHTLLLIEGDADPRLVFGRVLTRAFPSLQLSSPGGVDPAARIDPSARLAPDVTVGPFCYVGADVEIGAGSVLHPGVVVHARSVIGARCVVNSHCVIGGRGFGFVRAEDGTLEHFPQIGRVVIEDDVELQALTTVDRPAMGETRILCGTKVDNHVHVAHGARVGPHAIITACAEIGAEVVVGEGAWVGPNACSLERVVIGDRALVGIGAVVVHDVPADAVVAGSPAEPTATLRRRRAVLEQVVAGYGDEAGGSKD